LRRASSKLCGEGLSDAMKMRTRPDRSTTATEMATLVFAHSSIAPSAMASPNFQVMSRCIWTWAFEARGTRASAIVPTTKPAFVNMKQILPLDVAKL
jgi:hypothetical protein